MANKYVQNVPVNTYALGALLQLEGNDVVPYKDFVESHQSAWDKRAAKDAFGNVYMPKCLGIFDENDLDENSPTGQKAWQDTRKRHLVTGSKCGEFLGGAFGEYSSPREIIAIYVGNNGGVNPFKVTDSISPEVARRGHIGEPLTADTAIRTIRTMDPDAELVFDPGIYESHERPYISFSPDRLLYADLDGTGAHFSYLEIKTFDTNSPNWKNFAYQDKIPPLYYAQLALGMYVLNLPDAYLAVKASWGPMGFKLLHVTRNPEFEAAMLARLDEAWDYASRGEIPAEDWGGTTPSCILKTFFREYGTPKPSKRARTTMDFEDKDGTLSALVKEGIEAKEAVEAAKQALKDAEDTLAAVGARVIAATGGYIGKGRIETPEGEEDIYFDLKTTSHTKGEFDETGFAEKYPNEYRESFNAPSFSKTKAEKLYPHLVKEFESDPELTVTDKDTVKASFWKGSTK